PYQFPDTFKWGVATSSYQIEGGWDRDGKGASVWDLFVEREGRIYRGQDGKIASGHYHCFKEDVGYMAQMGLEAYRFSLSWARILPDGTGKVNAKGLKFYDALIDELLAHDIEPWVTLFHWDYPYELFLRGGWLNRKSPKWFEEYAKVVVEHFSDRVSKWMTINEPQCFIGLGHRDGSHAPGLNLSMRETLLAGHHALLAHGRSVQAIREHAKLEPQVGWSGAGSIYRPATDSTDDVNAARQASRAIYTNSVWNTRWWADPVLLGHYPEDGLGVYGKAVPDWTAADMKLIHQPIDFFGCNIFQAPPVRLGADGVPVAVELAQGEPVSLYEWTLNSDALYWGPYFIHELYGLPVVVAENGCSLLDQVSLDGGIHDSARSDFIVRNLLSLRRCMQDGVDVQGYFHWSLLDNFEWQEGYKHRYGLIHVNYETQTRTLKDSAFTYKEIVETNGACLQKYSHTDEEPVHYVVKEAQRYIDANITEVFNVKTIAAHLNCHPDFLSRRFKQHTGTSLSAHIRRVRIELARTLLRDSNILIGDVADRCGFSDRIHFAKVFRKEMGMAPVEYQRQFRLSSEVVNFPAMEISKNPRLT
ncbi:MAG: GH1 family beta-glucosidase, partial [Puniceicoccales bacterium]